MFEIICFTCGEFNFDEADCGRCGGNLGDPAAVPAAIDGQTANVA